jgi:tetratricopeptide (TPR) repeat protein
MHIKDRPYFIAQLVSWHEEDRHDRIIEAIEKLGREQWDYDIASLYARALNNAERYGEALDVLLELEDEGKEDGVWYFRIGYALYYLNREAEAAEFFRQAIEHGDDEEDTRLMLQASEEEAELRRTERYSPEELDALEDHIEKYFGPYRNVYHEIESPDIHVDIAVVEPRAERNYYTLVTMGMGAHRMKTPPEMENQSRAEILVCLPPNWNLDDLEDERWYWPLRWLKILARLPLNEESWLGWGHTIPNGEPFADNTKLCTVLLLNPCCFDDKASFCTLPGGEKVNLYQMIPLYEEEAQFKIKNNAEIFLRFLDKSALEYINVDRENICEPTGGPS